MHIRSQYKTDMKKNTDSIQIISDYWTSMSDRMYFQGVLPRKTRRAVCGTSWERGPHQTMTSSMLAKVNVRQGASTLVSVLVSRWVFCLDTCSDDCGPSM